MAQISSKSLLAIAASLFLFASGHTRADIGQAIPEFGDLDRWTLFSLGGGRGFGWATGPTSIEGDIGLAGLGKFLIAGRAIVSGDIYVPANGHVLVLDPAMVNGSIFPDQDALLDNGVNEALAAAAAAAGLTPNRSNNTIRLHGAQNVTITGAPGETVVLDLKNFALRGDSSFTLAGTATTNFVINISRRFALRGRSHIDLAGLQWNQVLFNVISNGQRAIIGGSSVFNGILMANNRTIEIRRNSISSGEFIGNRIKLNRSPTVTHPPVLSP